MRRLILSVVLAAAALLSGCFTPMVTDAISEVDATVTVVETVRPVHLDRAVRTPAGVTYIQTGYSDGAPRTFSFDPLQPLGARLTLRTGGLPAHGTPVDDLLLSGTSIAQRAPRGLVTLACLPTYQVSRVETHTTRAALKKLAYVLVGLPLALVGDATLGAAYGLFCTEAGWRLIIALALCWAR